MRRQIITSRKKSALVRRFKTRSKRKSGSSRQTPDRWVSVGTHGAQRVALKRFPYFIYYFNQEERISIIGRRPQETPTVLLAVAGPKQLKYIDKSTLITLIEYSRI